MSYLKEHNAIIQKKYGYYCSKCKKMNKKPVTYTDFKSNFEHHIKVMTDEEIKANRSSAYKYIDFDRKKDN